MKNNAAQLPQIFNRKNQSTLCRPPTNPTAVTAPTIHCVVDTGIPKKEAVTTVSDAPNSADEPREGDNMISIMADMGAIVLATSLAPCAKEFKLAVNTWMKVKRPSAFSSNCSS
ncbi:hypothetical protein ACHAWU_007616 [Discostella pseudostelligera]|uniref:Uncharacterized protein n=1 Tax=Discostella pseudostelligera TaxID=259834 RepID=A0ABD3M8E0_9STRA